MTLFGIVDTGKYYLLLPLISLPVVAMLWWFRTYDVRQQIKETQTLIQQGNFISGLNKLVEKDTFRISIGVQLLTQVSKSTDAFDADIRLAFIKRIQKLPDDMLEYTTDKRAGKTFDEKKNPIKISDPRINYLPHIFRWIVQHAKRHQLEWDNEFIELPEIDFWIDKLPTTKLFFKKGNIADKKITLQKIKNAIEPHRPLTKQRAFFCDKDWRHGMYAYGGCALRAAVNWIPVFTGMTSGGNDNRNLRYITKPNWGYEGMEMKYHRTKCKRVNHLPDEQNSADHSHNHDDKQHDAWDLQMARFALSVFSISNSSMSK